LRRIAVLGAGVSGLTCAVALQDAGYDVTVVAAEPPLATVSAVAAAAWYPTRGERDERTDRWLRASYERFMALSRVPGSGVVARPGVELLREPRDDAWWREILPGFRHAPPPPGFADAWESGPVPIVEMPVYLAWLTRRVRTRARILVRHVGSLDELPGDGIVNCAGLGAAPLTGDAAMTPVRGQVVRVRQNGLERFIIDEQNPEGVTYVFPRSRDVVLGGVREEGNSSPTYDREQERAIIRRCAALEPRVANAPILTRAAGLRPGRPSVRLEPDEIDGRPVVHDYGHGGSGVALSWGCAREVAGLLRRIG